jgi:hypothetical protein
LRDFVLALAGEHEHSDEITMLAADRGALAIRRGVEELAGAPDGAELVIGEHPVARSFRCVFKPVQGETGTMSSAMAQLNKALIWLSTRFAITGASWAIPATSAFTAALSISESRLPFQAGRT